MPRLPRSLIAPCLARPRSAPGLGTIATSGGLPAASRVRITGSKSRAPVYVTSIPVLSVNAFVTLRNASFSLPPQSERTSIFFAAGFELAVAANVAATTPSTTASRTSQERRFKSIPPRSGGWLGRHFPWSPRPILPLSTGRNEALLRVRIEEVQTLGRDGEFHVVADLHL